MHSISQELSIYTQYGTWLPARNYTEQDLKELRRDAVIALFQTPTGQELLKRGGDSITERLLETFAERYDGKYPSTHPFFETLLEAAQDLLADLPAPAVARPTPKPISAPVVSAEDKEKARLKLEADSKHEGKVRQFAYLVKKQLNRDGYQSLKPRGGVVKVVAETGDSYDYPSVVFDNLWADGVKLGLLNTGGLQ
jgi:hypothetical protein